MEEELNENDLEERLYAMLHHVDATQNNLIDSHQNKFDALQFAENGPRSTLRRYWRTGPDNNPYHKSNIPKDPVYPTVTKPTQDPTPPALTKTTVVPDNAAPKAEKSPPKPPSPVDLSIFQSPPQNIKKTIIFLDHNEKTPVVLESSDEDEVVEVALPPKPTITIESSDEDELHIVKEKTPEKADPKSNSTERAVSASPVPSVVSSVSDEFIRGDCIALNISSRHPNEHSFDFTLHGSDLLGQTNASSKKKKRKKNKEAVTSTPIVSTEKPVADACFATPKSKAKNKKQRSKFLTEKSVPTPDVYDSDSSNLSTADTNKNPYIVTEKSFPSVDVYDSDSNQSEIVKEKNTDQSKDKYVKETYSSDSSASDDKLEEVSVVSKKNISHPDVTVDLTENDKYITIDDTGICDNIVMGNVIGFAESTDYGDGDTQPKGDISKYVSSKVPSILNDNLDFDNLKGNEKVCKKKRYSLTTLRAEMEKFYNESWGGEDFNHKEIQKNMSRDKSLWAIDPKDRMQSIAQRKAKCNYCNRVGHRDDTCRQKPPVCYMCGNTGHYEPRCPTKICVNCGAPNFMYSTMCRNCSSWPRVQCAECGQGGHPASHCPDVWRRYHNTTSTDMALEMCNQFKKPPQQYCSGCAKRGHLIHACRNTLPFSGLPINSPQVKLYRPIYAQTWQPNRPARSKSFSDDTRPGKNTKRQSKSPTVHETHVNKRKNLSVSDADNTKGPVLAQKYAKEVDNTAKIKNKTLNRSVESVVAPEKAPDFIPVNSSNHDMKGRVIQDNEVSDTSHLVTSARIYVTIEIINKLKAKAGEEWLKATSEKFNVQVGPTEVNSFLSITGKHADQELFQSELREWVQPNTNIPKNTNTNDAENSNELQSFVPKNRHNLLRFLDRALKSLNENLGDPRSLHKNLQFAQNKHEKLLKQKVISPQKLTNSRSNIQETLQKLNIVLVGQAGLAHGSDHLNELVSIRQKLMSSREKNIAPALRKEIDEHYRCIFSPTARNDYLELMQKYYHANEAKLAKRRNKRRAKKADSNTADGDKRSIPSEESERAAPAPPPRPLLSESECNTIRHAQRRRKLVTFSKKLISLRNSGAYPNFKHEMQQLLRKIHPCIAMLHQKKIINSKQTKKVKKVEHEAQTFLAKM